MRGRAETQLGDRPEARWQRRPTGSRRQSWAAFSSFRYKILGTILISHTPCGVLAREHQDCVKVSLEEQELPPDAARSQNRKQPKGSPGPSPGVPSLTSAGRHLAPAEHEGTRITLSGTVLMLRDFVLTRTATCPGPRPVATAFPGVPGSHAAQTAPRVELIRCMKTARARPSLVPSQSFLQALPVMCRDWASAGQCRARQPGPQQFPVGDGQRMMISALRGGPVLPGHFKIK